ncbi:MAG: serine hydrolase [Clostridia bacterium]|nr:serine hydrolase [Clostridia bacterium]
MEETANTFFEMEPQDTIRLPRASCPEDVGIPGDAVRAFVESLEANNFRYHSLYILRGGKVAAECHRYPFSPDIPHILYSISKSVTSCAVGLAIEEGYLTLDTSIAEVFPEYVPENDAEAFSEIKVRHLLNMTSGKFPSYIANKTKGEWIRQFAGSKWYAKPGEQFKYVNENPFMLCAMLRKLTGMTVTEYLTPRLWEPLGVRTPYWETDETGTESGGWGLFLTPESFAKFTLMIHQRGVFNGKQIVPRAYIEEATSFQTQTTDVGPYARPGYGYCFWVKNENEFLSCGVFGQIGYSILDKDLCVVVTSGDGHTEHVYAAVDALNAAVQTPTLPAADNTALQAFLSSRAIDELPEVTLRSPLEETIQDKILWFSKAMSANLIGFPPSVLPIVAIYMTKDRAGNMDRFQFRFCGSYAFFQWREGDETCCVRLGMDGRYRISRITLAGTRYTIFAAGFWTDENTLEVRIRPIESIGIRYLTFTFRGKKVEMSTRSEPSLDEILEDVRFTVDEMFHTRAGKNIGGRLFDSLSRIAEPTMRGEVLEKGAYKKKKKEQEPETDEAELEKEMEEIEEIELPADATPEDAESE